MFQEGNCEENSAGNARAGCLLVGRREQMIKLSQAAAYFHPTTIASYASEAGIQEGS